jgi:hypothetical protein
LPLVGEPSAAANRGLNVHHQNRIVAGVGQQDL